MDHVHHLSVEKITKMLDRGLDPNYHDLETGGQNNKSGSIKLRFGFVQHKLMNRLNLTHSFCCFHNSRLMQSVGFCHLKEKIGNL